MAEWCQDSLAVPKARNGALTRYGKPPMATPRLVAVLRLTDLIESFLEIKSVNDVAGHSGGQHVATDRSLAVARSERYQS